jgi:hypothetical protein
MMKDEDIVPLFNRMAECAALTRGSRKLIEYVIAQGQQPTYLTRGASISLLLVNPVPCNGVVEWTIVSPCRPEFRDVVTNRVRRGFLPIGFLDTNTPAADVFGDIVPPAYRADFLTFAKTEFELIYATIRGNVSGEESWLNREPVVVYESEQAETITGDIAITSVVLDSNNPRKRN